jgi:hypothetical protein
LGAKLALCGGPLEEKCSLTGGANRYYRALRIHRHFPSLAEALAFRGTLRDVLKAAGKRDRPPVAASTKEKAVKALIKAADGSVREALLMLVKEGYCSIGAAVKWLHSFEEQIASEFLGAKEG